MERRPLHLETAHHDASSKQRQDVEVEQDGVGAKRRARGESAGLGQLGTLHREAHGREDADGRVGESHVARQGARELRLHHASHARGRQQDRDRGPAGAHHRERRDDEPDPSAAASLG